MHKHSPTGSVPNNESELSNNHTKDRAESVDCKAEKLHEVTARGGNVVSIPQNLDLDSILAENPPNFNYKKDKFFYTLGLIVSIPANNKDLEISNRYVPFYSKCLKSYLGNDYLQYLLYLKEHSILECDGYYIPEEKSKGFRYTNKYNISDFGCYEISDLTINQKLNKVSAEDRTAAIKYKYLHKYFNEKLTIDSERARKFIAKKIEQGETEFACQYYNVNKLDIKKFWFHVDKTGKRLHTNLTNIKRELRNFISYDNQQLVCVDIANAQPFISTKLIIQHYKGELKQVDRLEESDISNNQLLNIQNPSNNIIMFPIIQHRIDYTDVTDFILNTTSGTLYEYMMNKYEDTFNSSITRDEMKELFCKVSFSPNYKNEGRMTKWFSSIFPNVYEVYRYEKRYKHNKLAIALQRVESNLILNKICKRIATEKPKLPIFTVHDSVVTSVDMEDYVKDVMEDELTKEIGFTPKLKYEYWTPDNLDWHY